MTPIGYRCPDCNRVNGTAKIITEVRQYPNGEVVEEFECIEMNECHCLILEGNASVKNGFDEHDGAANYLSTLIIYE